jgi:hypothetical protein
MEQFVFTLVAQSGDDLQETRESDRVGRGGARSDDHRLLKIA